MKSTDVRGGQSVVGYALILALVVLVVFAAVIGLRDRTSESLSNSANTVANAI